MSAKGEEFEQLVAVVLDWWYPYPLVKWQSKMHSLVIPKTLQTPVTSMPTSALIMSHKLSHHILGFIGA